MTLRILLRCHHVRQEPGVLAQAAGDVGDVVDVVGTDLEASHVDLEEREHGSALLTDVVSVLPEDEHDELVQKSRAYNDTLIDYIDVCRHPSLCQK